MNIRNTILIACCTSSISLVSSFKEDSKITLSLVEGNIAAQKFDNPARAALVNAANNKLAAGGGVCGALFKAAGYKALTIACKKHTNGCPLGQARITDSCAIKNNAGGAHHIIHAVGPQTVNKKALLYAYYNSLIQAEKHGITAIAFPAISTGIFGYDVEKATPLALFAIIHYVKNNPQTIIREIRLVTFKQSHQRMHAKKPEDYWVYVRNLQKQAKMNEIKPATSYDARILSKVQKTMIKQPHSKKTIAFEIIATNSKKLSWINKVKKFFSFKG